MMSLLRRNEEIQIEIVAFLGEAKAYDGIMSDYYLYKAVLNWLKRVRTHNPRN